MIRTAHHIAQALCQHRALGHLHLPASCARSIAGPAPCQFCRLFGERSDFCSNKLRKTMGNPEVRIEVEKNGTSYYRETICATAMENLEL